VSATGLMVSHEAIVPRNWRVKCRLVDVIEQGLQGADPPKDCGSREPCIVAAVAFRLR